MRLRILSVRYARPPVQRTFMSPRQNSAIDNAARRYRAALLLA